MKINIEFVKDCQVAYESHKYDTDEEQDSRKDYKAGSINYKTGDIIKDVGLCTPCYPTGNDPVTFSFILNEERVLAFNVLKENIKIQVIKNKNGDWGNNNYLKIDSYWKYLFE